jgi:hypothetical protein
VLDMAAQYERLANEVKARMTVVGQFDCNRRSTEFARSSYCVAMLRSWRRISGCFALSASRRSRAASWRYFSALVEGMMNINATEQF